FGEEWLDLKAKVLAKINIKLKMLEDVIKSDIEKIEKLCGEYKYWEARDFMYEKLKGRPDRTETLQRQYRNVSVAGPIIDIIFSDIQHLVQLKCWKKNRFTNSTKIINDRSKCLRTNKSVLDQYLSHDLSDEIIENSAVIGLQLAALHGQIIGIDLLDEGLYFRFEGPILRFPTQINDTTVLKQTLELFYFFKENIVRKAEALSCLNKDSGPFSNTFHTERILKPNHHKADLIRSTYFTSTKQQKK
ncbi:13552_t:CDS:2, partial [Funneliformis caledonium]